MQLALVSKNISTTCKVYRHCWISSKVFNLYESN